MEDYTFNESIVRTNKLWCSDCGDKIRKGDRVVFKLDSEGYMDSVFCPTCSSDYSVEVYHDSIHPFSEEAF